LLVIGATADAARTIEEKIDSLFVIAASLDIKYRDQVEPARDSIAALGADAVPKLIDMLGTKHARERVALREIFKKIGDPAVPLLNDALTETDSLRQSRVALMLYYLPDSSSVKPLLKVIDVDYYWTRYQAVRALGKIGDQKATDAIKKRLEDENELVRTVAAAAAGWLNDPDLIYPLIKAFNDPYYGVRMAAHEALKELKCGSKKQYIEASLTAPSSAIRRHLLGIIADDTCRYDPATVKLYMGDEDPVIRTLALKAAYRLDPKSTYEYLSQLPDTTRNLLVEQTVDDLTSRYETKTSSEP
jgi:HEAT repeat protein